MEPCRIEVYRDHAREHILREPFQCDHCDSRMPVVACPQCPGMNFVCVCVCKYELFVIFTAVGKLSGVRVSGR